MSFGFGTPQAPAAGGFGKSTGFGSPAPSSGFGKGFGTPGTPNPSTPAAGGFGTPAAPGGFGRGGTTGGFGTPATGGFGAPATGGFGATGQTGGFGAPAAGSGGFGAPAAGGFGSPAGGGFGAPAAGGFGAGGASSTGFGATAGGFGAGAGGGFGQSATGGFGQTGGFGAQQQQQQQGGMQFQQPGQHLVAAHYLLQWDNVYNAVHPDCKFRHFVYNLCANGQGDQAVMRERLTAQQKGGGAPEEQWIMAKRSNPDPDRMYPHGVHFIAGLHQRAEKQKDAVAQFKKSAENLAQRTTELRSLQEEVRCKHKKLLLNHIMLTRKVVETIAKAETLRQHGLKLGPELSGVLDRAQKLLQQLNAPNSFKGALAELQPYLERKANVSGAAGAGADIDPTVMAQWVGFLDAQESALRHLQRVVDRDTADVATVKERCAAIGGTALRTLQLQLNSNTPP